MADTAAGLVADTECSLPPKIVVPRVLGPGLRHSPMLAALACTMNCTAWLRVIEPIIATAARICSPTNHVGPFARLSKASAMTSATVRGVGRGVVLGARAAPLGFEAAQCGCVGLAEDQAEHVDALVVQFGPQRFGEHHVERLAGAVGHHVRSTDQPRARNRR